MGLEGIPVIIGACCMVGMALAISLAIAANYGTLVGQASAYDEQAAVEGSYDLCGGAALGGDGTEVVTTGWTAIFKYNFAMYLIYTICFGMSLLCGPLAMCFYVCLGCTGIPMLVCFILTGIRIFNNAGSVCRENATEYTLPEIEEVLTFAGDGDLMRKLWIAQLSTNCFMLCCGFAGIQFSMLGWFFLLGKDPNTDGFKFMG